ncbi:ATP-grasp domain-containing protein [Arthrobacter sp. Br18]|uniref:ATP-grasp domain-containing protein n=1 Tax=Arthrobacter sp. Br18 TaxID=1312954 RepID=UPI00047BCEAB|nr:ATP-grasp domain-containing protein [Arthrobacter sp. Br18]
MTQNIFVVGLDDLNHSTLLKLPNASQYTFHQLLEIDELQGGSASVPELLDKAQRQLDAFDGSFDAIVGFWDFPVSMMVPILCKRHGFRSADLEAVVKCEHKYWSRLEQQKVIDEYPAFGILDLTAEPARLPDGVSYPVWIKPIKSYSSEGAHYVESDEQLQVAQGQERGEVDRVGGPFNDVLALLDLPPEIAEVGGSACLVEEAATGSQVTVEGFSQGGRVEIYGVIDSISYDGAPSFLRYQYPSRLPTQIQDYMADVSRKVVAAVGLTDTTFNIEYFWNAEKQQLRLLEVNARHSQSHAPLFELVDGVSNHAYMLDMALDRQPPHLRGEGPFGTAAKWFLRRFSDGVVQRMPTAGEIAELERKLPGTTVHVTVTEGSRLSEGYGEDSYSYVLAEIFLGGTDESDLEDKYAQCVDALGFRIDDVPEGN